MRLILFVSAFLVATIVVMGANNENERYIILLEKGSDVNDIEQLIQSVEVHAESTREEMSVYSISDLLPFVFANISETTAEMVSNLPNVELIEKDRVVHPMETFDRGELSEEFIKFPLYYNLDIVDDTGCTDGTYQPFNNGKGVDIYIVDTGIKLDHDDFMWGEGGYGSRAKFGYDAIDRAYGTNTRGWDPHGHGTHCAGIAAGVYTGVAKDANLISVRVLGVSSHPGSWAAIIDGLNYIARAHVQRSESADFKGSIASISLIGNDRAAERAANELWGFGIVVVVASGNYRKNGCVETFCETKNVICVGAHGYSNRTCVKKIADFSNYGTCVDIIAPGLSILSASITGTQYYREDSGTSMACPHVSGTAALMKAADPSLTPSDIEARLKANAIDDIDRRNMPRRIQRVSHSKRLYITEELVL